MRFCLELLLDKRVSKEIFFYSIYLFASLSRKDIHKRTYR